MFIAKFVVASESLYVLHHASSLHSKRARSRARLFFGIVSFQTPDGQLSNVHNFDDRSKSPWQEELRSPTKAQPYGTDLVRFTADIENSTLRALPRIELYNRRAPFYVGDVVVSLLDQPIAAPVVAGDTHDAAAVRVPLNIIHLRQMRRRGTWIWSYAKTSPVLGQCQTLLYVLVTLAPMMLFAGQVTWKKYTSNKKPNNRLFRLLGLLQSTAGQEFH